MQNPKPCPFCTLPSERVIDSGHHGVVIRDGFPISPGHTLIIPKRHTGSFFELVSDEQLELISLLNRAKSVLDQAFNPQGYNIGIKDDGPAAGQTVPHLHIHLIPRYAGDQADPRGGVRWIIQKKSRLLEPALKPLPEFQLDFLSKVQRLFSEGDFTATYKFGLLIALAGLAVELGHDDGSALKLSYQTIGLKFIRLYWQQATPYSGNDVLLQNLGTQAAIVKCIGDYRRVHPAQTLYTAQGSPDFNRLLRAVTSTVKKQPIQYIQNLGGSKTEFLFDTDNEGITLLPGVAFCLRRFQPLVQQLSRSHWIDHVKSNRLNSHLLGQDADLESFLFGTSRQALTLVSVGLRKLTDRCHYCQQTVKEADVDHFIPHALYPRDLVHNFVLAHPSCNRSKSDTLAAKQHLENWLLFVQTNADNLSQIGYESGIVADRTSINAVVRWGYSNAVAGGSQAWIKASQYEPIDYSYLGLFE